IMLHCVVPSVLALVLLFQAEDGIRVLYVTGVQTCAIPIFIMVIQSFSQLESVYGTEVAETIRENANTHFLFPGAGLRECRYYSRSEERRAGTMSMCPCARLYCRDGDCLCPSSGRLG